MSDSTLLPALAGEPQWRWPLAGDAQPPGGLRVLLLTEGEVCVTGVWSDDGRYFAWAPMPRVDKRKLRETIDARGRIGRG